MKTRLRLLTLSALAALAGSAGASDAPHDVSRLTQPACADCHLPHGAAGPALTVQSTNANLCLTCHASQTNPTVAGWASGDQATATTGSSHSWSGAASALDKGAVPPTGADMAGKLAGGTNLQCSTCHNQHSQANAPFDLTAPTLTAAAGRHFLQTANGAGQLCVDCHAPWNQTSAAAGTYLTAGTASFTNNNATVTGTGTTWVGTVQPGWRIKALSHAASAWAYVKTVNSNTSITLVAPYTGATAAGAAYVASKTLSHPIGDPQVASSLVYGTPLDANGVAQVPAVFGSATGGSTTTLQDTTKNFTGMTGRVVRFTSGTNRGQTRTIASIPSSSQLGWTLALTGAVTAGTTYQVDLDGNFSNNLALVSGGAASFTTGSVACQTCHGVHFADSNAATFGDRPPTPVGTGDGKLLRRAATATCDACHPGWLMHSSATVGTKYGTWGTGFTCETCHQPHKTGNAFLVRDTIATPNSGNRDVDLRTIGGGVTAYGLANSTTPGTGPCETCHTSTRNGSEVTGTTSTFTALNTAVTLNSTTGLAAGWEVKRTADGAGAWTRIASVNTATSVTLSAGYRGATGTGTWQAANPRFRNTGSGRGAAGTEHYVTACLGCHTHQSGFKGAGESTGLANCDGCHSDLTARMTLASGGNTLGGRPILSRHQVTGFGSADSNTTWSAPLNGTLAANRSCLNMCHGDHPHDLTSPPVATHEYNAYLDATSQASRGAATRTSATRTQKDFDAAQANGGLCLSCHRFAGDAATPVQHPAVALAAYTSSAHNYTSNTVGASTYDWQFTQHDGGVFQRNCTKCHAGNGDGSPNSTALPMEAVHYSANPSLLAGNMSPAAAGNVVAEQICFGCHGNGTVGQNRSGKNLYDEVTSTFGHKVTADAVHDTPSEAALTAGRFSGANRHVNCVDCHDPHQAQPVGSGARAGAITAYTVGVTDYNTGTASGTRNLTSVTGSGTVWTAAMVGRAISWNSDNPRVWYGITAVGSSTALTISPAVPANKSGAYIIRGAVADTLADSAQAWTKNQFKGWTLKLVSGAQAGRTSAIYGNGTTTAQQLLVKFPSAPAVGDRYIITPSGSRVASGAMPAGSPAMAGAWGVQPNYGTAITPPPWNDSGGCGLLGTANACEVVTAAYNPITSFTKTSASPPPEAYVCLKCHSSFAYGTTLANFPASPSGQPNVPDGSGQAWSNSVGAAMRQSDLASDANPANVGHHAILGRGRNQPMVASATLSSVRNPNWPAHTAGTVTVAANGTSVTLNTGTWPVNLVPGWFIYLGSAAPANPSPGWYEVTGVTSDTVLTIDRGCAAPSTCSTTSAYYLTAGLGNTFVPPWGPWSVLECSDCHRSSTLSDPLGPHGSATKWLLRGADTLTFLGGGAAASNSFTATSTPVDVNNLCLNCHRTDVYGDYTVLATPATPMAGIVYTFSRQNHPPDKDNGSSVQYRTRWGVMCMNCHGGARQGGIHGQNLGIGNAGANAQSYSGRRLLAGSSWYAVTRSSTTTAGQCWTKGSVDAVDSCGHSHSGVSFQSGAANYDYDSTQGGGAP